MALFDDELRKAQQQRAMYNAQLRANQAQRDYENQAAQAQANLSQAQSRPMGGLESVLAGIGEKFNDWGSTIGNIGRTVIGSVSEPFRKAETDRIISDDSARRNEIARKYGYDSYSAAANDRNASQDFWNEIRNASESTQQRLANKVESDRNSLGNVRDIDLNTAKGQALSTASDVLQILGPVGNVVGGVTEGIGGSYKGAAGGTDADVWGGDNLGRTLGNAAIGGATAFIGDKVGGKLASKAPGDGILSRAIHSNVGRGTIAGAAAGATGGGLGAALNGGDVLQSALQGGLGGAMAGGTMAGTMGLIGSGIDRLNRKYNAEPQTPDIPAAKPIVDEVAEQYTKPATIETALQEAQTPTRRQIDVQYDGSGNGNVAVNRQRRNMYRLPDRSGSTLDGVLGPNNKLQLPNDQKPTYKADALTVMKSGKVAEPIDTLRKMGIPDDTINALKDAAGTYQRDIGGAALQAYGLENKTELPYLNREQYYRDNAGQLAAKGGNGAVSVEDIDDYMYGHLRDSAGKNSLGGNMTDNESIMREAFGERVENMTLDEMYDEYRALARSASMSNADTYSPENIAGALAMDDRLNKRLSQEMYDRLFPATKIDVDGQTPLAERVDVNTPSRGQLIQDVMPAQRQAQPQVQAQPIQETPTPRTPAQPVADEPIAVTDRAEFDRRYKADNYRTKAAQRTLAQFGNVDAPAKRSAKAIETAKFMNGLDLFKKGDIDYAAETVTGRNGAIAQAVTKAAQDADPVKINLKNVSEGVQRGLATSSLTDAKKKAVATSINAYNERLSSLANPDGTISPNDVLNTIRNVESDAATLLGKDGSTYRRPTSTDTRMAHVLQDYARDLQDIVDDNVNIKGVITPELSAQLKNAQPGNQKWAEWVDKTLDGAKTVKDLRKAQAPFVRMARFAENAEAQSTNNLPTTKSAILNQAVAGIVNSNDALARRAQYNAKKADAVMASNSNGVKGKVGDVAKNIASKAGKAADMLNNETLTGSALGRFATMAGNRRIGQGEAQAVENRAALQDATQQMQDIQSNYENSMLQAQQLYNQAQQVQEAIPSSLDRISAGMERALAAGDITAYGKLADLYRQAAQIYKLQNPTATTTAKDLSANQSKALTGLQQLQTLSQMQPGVGTALANSPLGGVVNMFGGDEYANQAQSLALTLGYLQSGANITPREAENIGKSYIPTAYDSENVRQQKLSRAEQLLRNYLADTSALQQ